MAEPAPADVRRSWSDDARRRLADQLGPPPDGPRPDPVLVDAWALGPGCPASWAHPDPTPFAADAPKAARTIGRLALERRSDDTPVPALVADLLAAPDELPRWAEWVGNWVVDAGPAARAVAAEAATAWAVGALAAAGRYAPGLVWDGYRQRVRDPATGVELAFTWDARRRGDEAPSSVLVVRHGAPDAALDGLVAGFGALVLGWRRSAVPPERIRFGSTAAGTTWSVEVGPAHLEAAVDRIVELVRLRRDPDGAPVAPGARCRHCHLLDRCDEGAAALGAPALRA